VIYQDLQAQIQLLDGALRLRSGTHVSALGSFTVSVHPLSTPSDPHEIPVKNHSIPSSLPQRVISSSLPFFALPEEEKLKYDIRKSANFKGYNALLSGNTDPEGRGDLHEGYNVGWEALEGHEGETKANAWYDQNAAMGGANVWPEGGEDMKEFRRAMLEY
jgi:isopenicillin N synthase-like dioxygenase